MTEKPRQGSTQEVSESQKTVEEFSLEDLVRLPDFYNPVVSPDGDRVAFYYDEKGHIELYVQDLDTGGREQISDGNVPKDAMYPLSWSADGESIYFHEDNNGDEQNDIHEMSLDGKRSPVIEQEGQCVLEDVGTEGRYLLFTSTAGEQKNLYRYDLKTQESEKITDYELPVVNAVIGPDNERVAYVTNETDDMENRDVYVAEIDGSNPRKLDIGETGAEASVSDWRGDKLLISDNTENFTRTGAYDLEEDEVEWYGPGNFDEMPLRFGPSGGVLALRSRECAVMPIHYQSVEDEGEELDLPEGVAISMGHGTRGTFTSDGRVLVSFGTDDSRQELVAYDLETDEKDIVIEAEYGDFDPESFTQGEYVTYESHDGLEIDGLLWDSGERPSPALVMVHGGPHGQSIRRFNPFLQYLLHQGYTVLSPNYRGSSGRGREFKNMVHKDWGGDEQRDIVEAGKWLKSQDWIDEDRVGVFGGSYGGYSTYCQMTMYPEEWKTGVAVVGMTDLKKLYEESMPHFKSVLEEQLGDPEESEEFYDERSPITHIENMKNSIGIIHGVNDPRCPISQARIFRDALKDMGWEEGENGDFEYHELGEEGHASTDTEQRIRQYQILVDYIEKRL